MVKILTLTVYNHLDWIHLQHTRMAAAFACWNFLLFYKKVVTATASYISHLQHFIESMILFIYSVEYKLLFK